ncbi:MAG: tetratricopeptide repeat protein [Acidobacteria bacterium]|nr:tetratricopeptide repeat protein [Acidobacteriota bacterium]NIM60165.1 tetratricopeptide repeat protein [Acidobacteriota bacterium]NIO57834.1 tetratricopeptide repeat protein [Acidobacteriota bacterium]NIQ28843.1 tetratricopeptide repeat protein [Acidobacteriota bacterium]NIQ83301.1 tetratricopeptide repeat protein [Acidobacteriota bacterium]
MNRRQIIAVLLIAAAALPVHAGKAAEVRAEAFRLLNQGVAAYRKGLYADAADKLNRAASMALNNFRAHYYLGLALIGDRRYDDAIIALDIALDLDPNHLQSHVAKGDALLKQGDLDESKASYTLALKLRPEYAPALDGLARLEEAAAEENAAIALYQRAISSDAGYAPAYMHLGDLYLGRRQFEEAVQLLEEAVSVRPDFADGLNRLAQAYGKLGLDTLAIGTIQNARELEPNDPSHAATLGWLYLGQGLTKNAETWFLAGLDLDRAHPESRRGLAEVARRRGQYELALNQVDRALADERLEALERRRLQEYRDGIDDELERLTRLEELRDAGAANPDDFAQLGMIYAARADWNASIEALEAAEGSHLRDERLGYVLFRAGRFRDALQVYDRIDISGSVEHAINRGVCAARLGHDIKAVEAYRRALELDPGNRTAQLYLGNAHLRLGEREKAVEQYKAFLGHSTRGEAAERVRRILTQIAPEAVAESHDPLAPVKTPEEEPGSEGS